MAPTSAPGRRALAAAALGLRISARPDPENDQETRSQAPARLRSNTEPARAGRAGSRSRGGRAVPPGRGHAPEAGRETQGRVRLR